MLRIIQLSVDPLDMDPAATITHSGTSYQVSRVPDMTDIPNQVLNLVNSSTDLTSTRFEYDMQPNEPLYVRTRYHLSNNTVSSWSNVISLSNTQVGLKSSNTVISTPSISVAFDYTLATEGEIVVTLDNVAIYSGVGTIDSTTWELTTTDGSPIYTLPKSTDVLTELRLPISILNGVTCFVAAARLHTNTNADSNIARTVTALKLPSSNYFTATLRDRLYRNATNYMLISDRSSDYTSVDIRVTLPGSVVDTYTNLDPYAASFYVGNLDIAGQYTIEVRALTTNGQYTPWAPVYTGPVVEYDIRMYSTTVEYVTTEMGYGGLLDYVGMSAQTTEADEDDVFYLAVPETDTLAAYRARNGSIYPIGITHTMPAGSLFDIPNINMMKLYDGNYLLDHTLASDAGNIEVPKFTQFSYNHITKRMVAGPTLIRHDERYGTGRCGSSVVTRDGLVHYIPGAIKSSIGNALDLEMRVYDTKTNTIVDNIPLPVAVKENVTLAEDANGVLYMFGGTTTPTLNGLHNELTSDVINRDLYKYDKITKEWTMLVRPIVPNINSYRFKMQTLRNGDLFIIDVTPSITSSGVRSSYIYNVATAVTTATMRNNPTNEHLGITISLYDGSIGLMSSTPETVESISFLRTTTSDMNVTATSTYASVPVSHLVIPVGETVFIRDPYRYLSITIEGSGPADTGILAWTDNGVVTEYYYDDLIVTRDMVIPATAVGDPEPTFNRVVVVGDATLTIL